MIEDMPPDDELLPDALAFKNAIIRLDGDHILNGLWKEYATARIIGVVFIVVLCLAGIGLLALPLLHDRGYDMDWYKYFVYASVGGVALTQWNAFQRHCDVERRVILVAGEDMGKRFLKAFFDPDKKNKNS